jgi:hypothetical protein
MILLGTTTAIYEYNDLTSVISGIKFKINSTNYICNLTKWVSQKVQKSENAHFFVSYWLLK